MRPAFVKFNPSHSLHKKPQLVGGLVELRKHSDGFPFLDRPIHVSTARIISFQGDNNVGVERVHLLHTCNVIHIDEVEYTGFITKTRCVMQKGLCKDSTDAQPPL